MKYISAMFLIFLTITVQAEGIAVVNKANSTVSLVSVNTEEVTHVPVGYLPHEVAATSTHAFVSNYGHQHVRSTSLKNKSGNTLSIINLRNPNLKEQIQLGPRPCAPHGIEANEGRDSIFVTCEGRNEIAMIDTKTKKLVKYLRTDQPGSHMLAVGKDKMLYVANFWIGTVSVIDITSGQLIKQINTGRSTEGIGLSPDGKSLYVTAVEASTLMKISTQTLEITQKVTLPEGSSPIRVLVSNDNKKLIVNHTGRNSTGIYDADTLELKKEINVGSLPIGLAVSRSTNNAYVANMNDGSVSVIDIESELLIKTMDLDLSKPDGLTVLN